MSNDFSHLDETGGISMVDVGAKRSTSREAVALATVRMTSDTLRKLIDQAPVRLNPGGLLALEIGVNQTEGLTELLRQKNYHDIEVKKDYSGIPRFVLAKYG